MSAFDDDHGMLHVPSPLDPSSGYTQRGFSRGSAPDVVPTGMVFVPEMNTYVDNDIASQLGLSEPSSSRNGDYNASAEPQALNAHGVQAGHDDAAYEVSDYLPDELIDVEIEDALEELDQMEQEREPSPSPTLDEIRDCFDPADFQGSLEALVNSGNPDDALTSVAQATGLDTRTASTLIETAVHEASPVASEYIGEASWSSLVHAASATDDTFARRIVAEVVTGKLHPSKLPKAYSLWWHSLPDQEV